MTPLHIYSPVGDLEFEEPPGTIYLAYRGSIAHGMYVPPDNPDSIDDIDLIGFVIGEPKHYFGLADWGSRGTKETKEIKQGRLDVVLYELRKAFSLLLQGNPNILGALWTERQHQILRAAVAEEIIAHRHFFVGKHVYNAFAGYAYSQLKRMETRDPEDLREYIGVTNELKYRGLHPNHKGEVFERPVPDTLDGHLAWEEWSSEKLIQRVRSYQKKGENLGYMGEKRKQLVLRDGYDSKNAAHLIRLLRMCVEFLFTGELKVLRPDAEELLDIKAGKWKLESVKELAEDLFEAAKGARDRSSLPEAPDREGAEKLLIRLIREAI